ncbi:hypothetical protein BH09PSE5_BH09PSE5_38910 [soil metagenome]
MAVSESKLLQALDLVTLGGGAEIQALGTVRGAHFARLRSVAADSNVVGVGISEKLVDGAQTGEATVCFYVRKKRSRNQVAGDAMVPQAINLPGDTAVFTDVKEIGALRLEATTIRRTSARPPALQSGLSVGHIDLTAGTLGAIVKGKGKLHLLSNSHVLAMSGLAAVGDPIVYPGVADGGAMPGSLAARLTEFVPFDTSGALVNRVDAAIAEIVSERPGKPKLAIYRATMPLRTAVPKRDMKVAKFGRTTGKTQGRVIDVNFRFTIGYPGVGSVGYVDQVLCTRYTDGGDSGSIVVDTATGHIVGLHFAGADGGSVFNPIRPVMKALGISFVSALA